MKKKLFFAMSLLMISLLCCAGCNKDTGETAPTPTAVPMEAGTAVPTQAPTGKTVPAFEQVVEAYLTKGTSYQGEDLYGLPVEDIRKVWKESAGKTEGLWADVWLVPGEDIRIAVFYEEDGLVSEVQIGPWKITMEPEEPVTPVPTPMPTNPPVVVTAPFAMVSPVPQGDIVDIVGTMTKETYPVVDGSTATLPLSEAVFMAATGESAEVAAKEVVHTKTTNSYNRLYNGEVDLLIVYEPAESIVERMKTEPLYIKPIGLDALVFLANTANPLNSLTMEQLVEIYSGKLTNWAEAGGMDKTLLAFQRPQGSGSQTLMQKLVMGDTEMVSGDNVFRYSTMSDILEGMLSYNNEDNTLGYSVFYYANNMYFEKDLKLMGVDGVLPSTRTIYDGSYPLTNAFYAVVRTDEPADSNARKIFDWLTGENGQQLVLDLGYVPVQMPAGADISDAKQTQQEKVEILATEPLEEGQYFVFANPQNMVSEYYYGDISVYNHNWEEVANFYNVSLNHGVQGIYSNCYLPIGQIRQNTAGEQEILFGVFDLEQGEYSVPLSYTDMELLDADRGYFAVPYPDENWMHYMVINGVGEILLDDVKMDGWMTIWKFGNGYQEMRYDYENQENGVTYRFYDENLKLVHVYCKTEAAFPATEERIDGVQYTSLNDQGCLVDADGNVIFDEDVFLKRYGDGISRSCKLQLNSPSLVEEGEIYPVLYKNQVYLLDDELELLLVVENQEMVAAFDGAVFFEKFCYYISPTVGEWGFYTYDGEPVRTSDGKEPDYMEKLWESNAYCMYSRVDNQLFVEEYVDEEEPLKYTITLRDGVEDYEFYYTTDGFVVLNENSGELMQSPYYAEEMLVPRYIGSLWYRGSKIDVEHGMGGSSVWNLDESHWLWTVHNGNRLTTPSESIFEDFQYSYALGNYTILDGQRSVYEIDNAYLVFRENDIVFFLSGNYMYAVGYDGTEYIRALHTFMSND